MGNNGRGVLSPGIKCWDSHRQEPKNSVFSKKKKKKKEAHFPAILGWPFWCIMGRKMTWMKLEAILKILVGPNLKKIYKFTKRGVINVTELRNYVELI